MSDRCEGWVRAWVAGGAFESVLPCTNAATALAVGGGPYGRAVLLCDKHQRQHRFSHVVVQRIAEGDDE